ncbi:MAG: glycosyltransferase [Marinilabiliales bacterium]|nr:glycosyltransferase [Marinilabiliales bacterium]
MKISVITPTLNSAETVADCILSVRNQHYPDKEHLLIDGGSTDETLALLKQFSSEVSLYCFESDQGPYHAMNRGIQRADGEIIAILNSDDLYNGADVLERVAKCFEDQTVDCVYGDLYYVNRNDTSRVVRHWKTGPYYELAFTDGWHPAHPSFFLRKSVYDQYGRYDLQFKIAADFELEFRMLAIHRIKAQYLPIPLVRMRLGGLSNRSLSGILRQNRECLRAFKVNGISISWTYAIKRLVKKIRQYQLIGT